MECRRKSMTCSPDKENKNSLWYKNKKVLNKVLFTMRRQSLTNKPTEMNRVPFAPVSQPSDKIQDFTTITHLVSDKTSLLSDEILLKILSKLPRSQRNANFLVSKRWLNLQGRLVRSIKVLDWDFLVSGRLLLRFPNLAHVDLLCACLVSDSGSGVFLTNENVSFHVGGDVGSSKDRFFNENHVFKTDEIDRGLRVLAGECPNLRKFVVMNCSEMGLMSVAEECSMLQELELHMCKDHVLRGIAAFENLEILKLSGGVVDDSTGSLISDIGLTILAQGCKRLVKLILSGCGGSYEGIKAIGHCCPMLEELTLCNHKMDNGWLLALPFCETLKTLHLLSCKRIDFCAELAENLNKCPALEGLHFEKCQLRDKMSLNVLFVICQNARELVIKNCWGLSDDMFSTANTLRKVRLLSLEGCAMLTTQGLESVLTSWNELQSLQVNSCNNIKDCEITSALSTVFSALKNLKWNPDTKSLVSSYLEGTVVRKRGSKYFKKSHDWKSLPGSQIHGLLHLNMESVKINT